MSNGLPEDREHVQGLFAEAGWKRANKNWQPSPKLADADDMPGFNTGETTIRYINPDNELKRGSIRKSRVRFFTQKGGILLEDESFSIQDDVEEIERRIYEKSDGNN